MNMANLTTALARLEKLSAPAVALLPVSDSRIVDDTLARLIDERNAWSARDLAYTLYSVSKLVAKRIVAPAKFALFAAAVERWLVHKRRIDKCNSQDLANIAYAMGRAKTADSRLFDLIADYIVRDETVLRTFSPQSVANMVWAFAECKHIRTDLFNLFARHVARHGLANFKPQELSNLVCAFADTNHPRSALLNTAAAHLLANEATINAFPSQTVANLAWAFAWHCSLGDASQPMAARTVCMLLRHAQTMSFHAYGALQLVIAQQVAMRLLASTSPDAVPSMPAHILSAAAQLQHERRQATLAASADRDSLQFKIASALRALPEVVRVDEEVMIGGDMMVDARVTLKSGATVLVEFDGARHFLHDKRTSERRVTGATRLKHWRVLHCNEPFSVVSGHEWDAAQPAPYAFLSHMLQRALAAESAPASMLTQVSAHNVTRSTQRPIAATRTSQSSAVAAMRPAQQPLRSALSFNRSLHRAPDVHRLLDLYASQRSNRSVMNTVNLTTVVLTLAKRSRSTASPVALTTDSRFESLVTDILSRMTTEPSAWEPRAITNTLYSISQFVCASDVTRDVFAQYARAVEQWLRSRNQRMDDFLPQHLSILVYAIGSVEYADGAWLLHAVADRIVASAQKLNEFKPMELCNTVWAFAKCRERRSDLFDLVGDHIAQRSDLGQFKAQELSNTLWAFAMLSQHHGDLFDVAAAHIKQRGLDDFKPQDIVNTAWAFGKLDHPCIALLDAISVRVKQRGLREFRPYEIRSIVSTFAKWNHDSSELVAAIATYEPDKSASAATLTADSRANLVSELISTSLAHLIPQSRRTARSTSSPRAKTSPSMQLQSLPLALADATPVAPAAPKAPAVSAAPAPAAEVTQPAPPILPASTAFQERGMSAFFRELADIFGRPANSAAARARL